MPRLEDLTVGCKVSGLVSNESVEVIAVKWHGSSVLTLTYKNSQGMLRKHIRGGDVDAVYSTIIGKTEKNSI